MDSNIFNYAVLLDKMDYKKTLGILFALAGMILIFDPLRITGFVIAENIGGEINSVLGLVFVIGGIIFFMAGRTWEGGLELNLAQKILKSRKILEHPREIKSIATQMGYGWRAVKEGYQILNKDGTPLTVIPKHNVAKGTYYGIMKALATGESSFRKIKMLE